MPHAESFNPKLVARTVSEPELNEAWDNLWRIWRGLDADAASEFRQLLKSYLEGEFSQNEWANVIHAVIDWRGLAAGSRAGAPRALTPGEAPQALARAKRGRARSAKVNNGLRLMPPRTSPNARARAPS
jgi:hypothetical protein